MAGLVMLVAGQACFGGGGKYELARDYEEREEAAFETSKKVACRCVSGARCDSPRSGYPESQHTKRAGIGERCCVSWNCSEGLACDPVAVPSVCAPAGVVAEKEAAASCAPGAAKVWDRATPAGCALRGRDALGYEALRRAIGPNLDRVRYVTAADSAILQSIERGIFFVLAGAGSRAWSPRVVPPSIDVLRDILVSVDPAVEIVVAEKRCLTKDVIELLKLRCDERGDGDAAWIRHGEVVALSGYGTIGAEQIASNTQKLFAVP